MSADKLPERVNPYAAPALTASHREPVGPRPALAASLRKVARGLNLCRVASILALLATIGILLGLFLAYFAHLAPASLIAVRSMGNAIREFCTALSVLGVIYCLAVPLESKALHLIQATVVFELLCLLVRGAKYVGGFFNLGYYYSEYLPRFVAAVCFFLFLRRVSESMERHDLAQRTLKLMRLYLPLCAFYVVLAGPLPKELDVRAELPRALLVGVEWVAYLGLLLLSVWYINLLRDIRLAILGEDGAKLIADATPNATVEITPVSRD